MMISVAFTALNESDLILTTLKDAVRDMDALGVPYEIIVVDNASTDDTPVLAEGFAAEHPQVRVVRHPKNLGYANSNLTAYKSAVGEIVAVVDSDGQQTLRDMPKFIEKIHGGADVVFGWRKERHDPAVRKAISFGLSICSRVMLKYKFHDINCGFRVVTARVAKSFETVTPVNYFGPELWVHAVLHGYKVDEVITEHFERKGGASIHKPWRLPLTMKKAYDYLVLMRLRLRAGL